jgi:hypothetical protein
MRKAIPLSAILSSLLASPMLAAGPVRMEDAIAQAGGGAGQPVVRQAANDGDVERLAQFHHQLRLINDGQRLDSFGMQDLQRQMSDDAQVHLDRAIQRLRQLATHGGLYEIQEMVAPTHNLHLEKAAFLGVATSAVTPTLRDQLLLPHGMGLIVDYVERDSPADQAGFKIHDVLQKFDDQLLVNPQQLAVLVRSKKAGDTVNFTVIRAGKVITVPAKLVEKDVPPLEGLQEPGFFSNPAGGLGLPGTLSPDDVLILPHASGNSVKTDADGSQVRSHVDDQYSIVLTRDKSGAMNLLITDHAGDEIYNGAADQANLEAELQKRVDDLKSQTSRVTIRMIGPEGQNQIDAGNITFTPLNDWIQFKGDATNAVTVTRSDDQYQITLHMDNQAGKPTRTLKVFDKKLGKMIFDGPAQTDDDLRSLPADVLDKVRKLRTKMDGPGDDGIPRPPGY